MAEGENLDQVFDAMGKSGARFVIGQVIGSQTNYFGGKHAEEPSEADAVKPGNDNGASLHTDVCDEELFKFIHPAITGEEERMIHEQIKKLVIRQGIQEICQYLSKLESEEKIFLPQSADAAYTELVRMGMPDGEGFSKKTFMKYYRK